MTTPINSLQIIIGKLLSKMLQIIILLTISLPILAIVRVFGGVSWSYIISSFFITLTAAIFAGTISLAFSIKNVHAYVVIIKTVFTLGFLYIVIPLISAPFFGLLLLSIISFGSPILNNPSIITLCHFNPLAMMSINTIIMLSPSGATSFYFWPVHCVIMLIASAIVIAFSVKVVRKVALRQILGELDLFSKIRLSLSKDKNNKLKEYTGSIREVAGPPVFWKEVRKPLIQGIDRTNNKIGLSATLIALIFTYLICHANHCLDEGFAQSLYVVMFIIIGVIFNIILSVSCITSEKESSAWPILLITSLNDWQILFGKALGIFYKCLPVWLLLAGHIILFTIVGYIHPIAFFQILIVVIGVIVFVTGFGIYISSLCKKTTWAIINSFAAILFVWLFVPIIVGIISTIFGFLHFYKFFSGFYYYLNPIVQVGTIMDAAGGIQNAGLRLSDLRYHWSNLSGFGNFNKAYPTTKLLLCIMLIYITFGVIFAWLAKRRFRKNIV